MSGKFDRGNKKWLSSFILPEHRKALELWFSEEIQERPELDEQKVEEVNRVLTQAYRAGRPVRIRYWEDGEQEAAGRIVWFEMGTLRIITEQGKMHLSVDQIIDVMLS